MMAVRDGNWRVRQYTGTVGQGSLHQILSQPSYPRFEGMERCRDVETVMRPIMGGVEEVN